MAIRKERKIKDDEVIIGARAIMKFRVSDAVMIFIVSLLSLTCVLPFLNIAAKSISGNEAVVGKQVFLIPKDITFEAYGIIFKDGSMLYAMGFSAMVTLTFTLLALLVTICAAYPLSKKRLKGKGLITFLLIVPMYFGAGLIPAYLLFKELHLLNTVWVMILPGLYSPFNMIIMKTFFQTGIPDSLEESAFLDGATNNQILWKVMLPLSKPILATLSLFYAVGRWNSYADNIYFTNAEKLKMISFKLYQMVSSTAENQKDAFAEAGNILTTPEVLQAASIMFVTIPIICIYPFLQKYFVKGVLIGSVKE